MSKEDIVKQLKEICSSQGIDITKFNLGRVHDSFMERIKDELSAKGKIRLHGTGTFYVVTTKEKQCRNPQTGKVMTVPSKRRVKFKASQTLLNHLNEKEEAVVS